jgi:threonine/homoserine/homoserine lactone efflux protein
VTTYIAFAAIAFLLVASPGPNLFLLAKNAPVLGVQTGLLNIAGICIAILCHATLSLIGVSAIVLASATAFSLLKFLGAAYLVYLGIMALRDAWYGAGINGKLDASAEVEQTGIVKAVAEGWFTNILNPKPAMFYLAIFPQFIDPGSHMIAQGLSLGALHAVIAAFWYGLVVLAMDQVRALLRRPAVARGIKGATGLLLIGAGVRLATLRSPTP